jgi:hypothetical protein
MYMKVSSISALHSMSLETYRLMNPKKKKLPHKEVLALTKAKLRKLLRLDAVLSFAEDFLRVI